MTVLEEAGDACETGGGYDDMLNDGTEAGSEIAEAAGGGFESEPGLCS